MDFHFGRFSGNSARSAFALAEAGVDFAAFPNVEAWLARLWARPAWKTAVEMAISGSP